MDFEERKTNYIACCIFFKALYCHSMNNLIPVFLMILGLLKMHHKTIFMHSLHKHLHATSELEKFTLM